MTDASAPDEPSEPCSWAAPPLRKEDAGLGQSLDGFSIALKALQIATNAAIAAAEDVAVNATADEVRQSWLASLMPLRYTVHHLQFRGSSLIRSIGDLLEQG